MGFILTSYIFLTQEFLFNYFVRFLTKLSEKDKSNWRNKFADKIFKKIYFLLNFTKSKIIQNEWNNLNFEINKLKIK